MYGPSLLFSQASCSFCFPVEIARKGGAKLIEMAKSGERGRFNKGNYQSRRIPCREVARTRKTLRRQATVGHVADNIFSERAALRRLTSMMSRRGGRKVPPRRLTRRHRMEPISQRAIPGLKVRTGIQKMPGRDASAAFPAAGPVLQHGFLASRRSRKSGGSRQSSAPSARRDASRSWRTRSRLEGSDMTRAKHCVAVSHRFFCLSSSASLWRPSSDSTCSTSGSVRATGGLDPRQPVPAGYPFASRSAMRISIESGEQ